MVAEGVSIKRETYLAVLMDRESNGPVIVASPAGGIDIEQVAEKHPELIFKVKWKLFCSDRMILSFEITRLWFDNISLE